MGVGAVAALVLIGTGLLVLALAVTVVACAARGRRHQALGAAAAALVLVALYAVALVGVSATAPSRTLATGTWKCFDDWCVSLTSAVRSGDTVTVTLATRNQGRRQQAPDTQRVWLLHNGVRDEVIVSGLAAPVAGGTTRDLPPRRVTAPGGDDAQLLVTEGGFPSALVIGDDNSPFHPQPAWPLN